jgi:type IV secretion system protein VirD4
MGYFLFIGAILGSAFGAAILAPNLPSYRGIIISISAAIGAGTWLLIHKAWFKNSPFGTGETWNTSHGSARWANLDDLKNGGLLKERGVLLGRFNPPGASHLLAWDAPGHLITAAPTRSGKGVGAVIPNLLTWPGSVLVNDPKGENFAVTHRTRRAMGQRVFPLDPFEVTGPSARFNPLDLLNPASMDVADDAAVLADMLLISSGDPRAAFWEDNARTILQALILHAVCEAPREHRNLPHVRHLLMSGPEEWADLVQAMRASSAAHGLLARFGGSIAQMSEKTLQDVLSTAKASTAFLDSPRLTRVLSGSDFDLADLKAGDLSLYLVLPPDKLDAYKRFLRLAIGSAMQACTRTAASGSVPALFLLDEFAQLGPMEPVKRAYTLLGGYGVKVWLFLQDLGQLQQHYGEGAQTFIANATVKQFFGVSDLKTAEEVSKMLGTQTITVSSHSANQGSSRGPGGGSSNDGVGQSVSQTGRPLLMPDEVMRLSAEFQILMVQSQAPIFARKLNYLTDPLFQGRFDLNPMHRNEASGPDTSLHVGMLPCPYCSRLSLIGRPTCDGCGGPLELPKAAATPL